MDRTKSLSCSWLTVEGAKEIIRENSLPSESIYRLMNYMSDSLGLAALRIHQPASRKGSTQITHEKLVLRSIPRRLNQVITFSDADMDQIMNPHGKQGLCYPYAKTCYRGRISGYSGNGL